VVTGAIAPDLTACRLPATVHISPTAQSERQRFPRRPRCSVPRRPIDSRHSGRMSPQSGEAEGAVGGRRNTEASYVRHLSTHKSGRLPMAEREGLSSEER